MKAFIILSLSLLSLNVFAVEVGESLAPRTCLETVQTAKREAKEVTPVVTSSDQAVKINSLDQ